LVGRFHTSFVRTPVTLSEFAFDRRMRGGNPARPYWEGGWSLFRGSRRIPSNALRGEEKTVILGARDWPNAAEGLRKSGQRPVNPFETFAAETSRWPGYRQLGSLQLLLGVKQDSTRSSPQIFFPARLGFLLYASFLSAKYLSMAALQSSTDW